GACAAPKRKSLGLTYERTRRERKPLRLRDTESERVVRRLRRPRVARLHRPTCDALGSAACAPISVTLCLCGKRISVSLRRLGERFAAEAVDRVVVDDADGLHPGVDDGGPHE